MATKTINLTGAEVAVTGLDGAHAHIRNDGTEVIYAAKTAGITAGADGVLGIPAGQAATVYGISGTVYMLGTGSAQIISSDYVESPFKSSAQASGSGADEVARAAINAHSGNADIHVTAEEKASWKTTAGLMLQAICPSNELIYDDLGTPSVMVKIPKMTWAQLGVGDSTEVFPAFIVNGQVVDALYFPKYENIVQNNRGYSLPAQDPAVYVTHDQSIEYSTNKGTGWHSMTRLEWCVIALWCLKNGFQPSGNNNFGKDISESTYKAIPTVFNADGTPARVATGTGPLTWYHNNAPDGIADLNGNVWEWTPGIRLVYGELQVLSHDGVTFGNDAADPVNSQGENSSLWRAIDGTTGALIVPNGSGTTANSLKLDYVSSAWKWITGTITSKSDSSREAAFENTTVDSTICASAQRILQALCLYKSSDVSGAYKEDVFFANNGAAERCFFSGGSWTDSVVTGVFSICGYNARSKYGDYLGFRSAFVNLKGGTA